MLKREGVEEEWDSERAFLLMLRRVQNYWLALR